MSIANRRCGVCRLTGHNRRTCPLNHQGQTCTFARHNLRSMRCDWCTGDQTAAVGLGKECQRQVINLKIEWTVEQDAVRREDVMNQMTDLLPGTLNLGEIVHTNQFVLATGSNLQNNDNYFTTAESIDFILRYFVDGHVQEKGQLSLKDRDKNIFKDWILKQSTAPILVGPCNSSGHL